MAEWQVMNTMTWPCHDTSGTLKANHSFTYLNLCSITCWAGRCGAMLQPTTTAMFLKLDNFNMPGLQVLEFPIHPSSNTSIQKGIPARFKQSLHFGYNLPWVQPSILCVVQNAAVMLLINGSCIAVSTIPMLKDLHCLLIAYCIQFKIFMLAA